jgi:hypothetical protein
MTSKGILKRLRGRLGLNLKPGSDVDFELAEDGPRLSQGAALTAAERFRPPARHRQTRRDDRRADGTYTRRGRGLILVDANGLVDLVTNDPLWGGWSQRQLDLAAAQDELAINDIPADPRSDGHAAPAQLGGRSPARSSRHSPALRPRDRGYFLAVFAVFAGNLQRSTYPPRRSPEV